MTIVSSGGLHKEETSTKRSLKLEDVENGMSSGEVVQPDRKMKERYSELEKKLRNVEEQLANKEDNMPPGAEKCMAACSCGLILVILLAIGIVYLFVKPEVEQSIHLARHNGTFGLTMRGQVVEEVIPGSAAALQGGLKKGDKIGKVNGNNVTPESTPKRIQELFNKSDEVDLIVERTIFNV
ncbi:hypothetical protein PMAYCL1PPCAC_09940 [Pristionchus mayeri]|uniref:PDZ domain-containing protein n=1 Tax=Pristionchus mayeri TaxID=1317129 RepID=A0AAN4ZLB8_9BILA|nr:hypothetical protein PMAYCL1PPCAC_09940 [Pristionchus mayeri]